MYHIEFNTTTFISNQVCDGVWDCGDGEDERECVGAIKPPSRAGNGGEWSNEDCDSNEYKCPTDGRCIPETALCDRREDCSLGIDEKDCKDDNLEGKILTIKL